MKNILLSIQIFLLLLQSFAFGLNIGKVGEPGTYLISRFMPLPIVALMFLIIAID